MHTYIIIGPIAIFISVYKSYTEQKTLKNNKSNIYIAEYFGIEI